MTDESRQMTPSASDDAVLFLWVTAPQLDVGLRIVEAWGFEYKTVAFVWVKTNPKAGTPFWAHCQFQRSSSHLLR